MTYSRKKQPAIRAVLQFVFQHWRNQPLRGSIVCIGLAGATVADVFMPLFAGRLVDAITLGATDMAAAQHGAMTAFGIIVGLGFASMLLHFMGLQAIVPFTLRIMTDVARNAFLRVQRFFNRLAREHLRRVHRAKDHARHVGT